MSDSCITCYLALVLLPLALLFYLSKKSYSYWSSRGVTQLEPKFPVGDLKITSLLEPDVYHYYKEFKAKGQAHGGIYLFKTPIWIPVDINLIKTIMVKDFDHFRNHGLITVDKKNNPLSAHLFHLEDDHWKSMRVKLTPTFTSGKMKMMFPTFMNCTTGLSEIINESVVTNTPIDVKDVLARFTTDIISSCAFGLECDSLKNPDEEFRKQSRDLLDITGTRKLKLILVRSLPTWISKLLGFRVFKTEFESFFIKAVKDIVEYREQNNVFRRDFMHLLLQLKNRGKVTDDENIKDSDDKTHEHLDIHEIAAQCFVFFFAGYETSSSAMTYGLYELSQNQEIQGKLRKEIQEVSKMHGGKLTYEAMSEMTYLDQVVKETLRKYPPIRIIPRKCSKNYTVPGSNVVIEKGTIVRIPVWPIHMDPEFYPDPEIFDPDRFTKENEATRPAFSWLPFGEGPRLCIGMRFGLLQTKVGLATILKNYRVTPNAATPATLRMKSDLLVAQCKDKILLDVQIVS